MTMQQGTDSFWILSYQLMGKTVRKKFDKIAKVDLHVYTLLVFSHRYITKLKLDKVTGDEIVDCCNSTVFRRWQLMQSRFPDLDKPNV